MLKSPIVKRSILVNGHKTSVSLEDEFWTALKVIAGKRFMKLQDLVTAINKQRRTAIFHPQFDFPCLIFIEAGLRTLRRKPTFWRCCCDSTFMMPLTFKPVPPRY